MTALLVRYRNAAGAIRIPSMINRQTDMQAAVPAIETARLLTLLGVGIDGARLFAWLLAAVGSLSIFVTLLNAASARRRSRAAARDGRAPGSGLRHHHRRGLVTAILGCALGIVLGHVVLAMATDALTALGELGLRPWVLDPAEIGIVAAVIGIGLAPALIPALRVFRIDLAATLSKAS